MVHRKTELSTCSANRIEIQKFNNSKPNGKLIKLERLQRLRLPSHRHALRGITHPYHPVVYRLDQVLHQVLHLQRQYLHPSLPAK